MITMKSSKNIHILLIILICVLSRIPILISPDLRLDSDECLVGLMAKHLYQGKDFSIYFWGQIYGITIIEELFIIPFYTIMGVNALAVKLGMLCLWTTGIVFFYKALTHIRQQNNKEALFITILMVSAPSWALWCMKARGGYLTAFTLTSVALYLLFHDKWGKKNGTYFFIAVLIFLISESQIFWLSGLMPLVLYKLIKERGIIKFAIMLPVFIALRFMVTEYKKNINIAYEVTPLTLTKDNIMGQIDRIPEFLYTHMHGTYHFSWAAKPSFFTSFVGVLFTALVFLLLIKAIAMMIKKEKGIAMFIWAVLFIPATFFYSLFSETMEYRYLLPVTGYTLLALYILLERYPLQPQVKTSIVIIMVLGFIGIGTFWKSQLLRSDREKLGAVIKYFQDNNIRYVYSADYTFQWDVMFLTNEKVIARFFKEPGRRPAYDFAVDKALAAGEKTAVFGNSDRRFGEKFDHYEMDDVYYISVNPTKETLQQIFEFKPVPDKYK